MLPDAFWEEHGVRCGVELRFRSTTTMRDVAFRCMAQSGKAAQVLFEVRMGMITAVHMLPSLYSSRVRTRSSLRH